MRIYGITGGVGAGKSTLLSYISDHYNCTVLLADNIANELKEPGNIVFKRLYELFGDEIITNGNIDNSKMSILFFNNKEYIKVVNDIIHPEVRKEILSRIDKAKEENIIDCLFIEAALLIECGYNEVVDEMWYVYAGETDRTTRLIESRSYSKDKINKIFSSQLSEDDFKNNSDFIIDNSKDLSYAFKQIDNRLEAANVRKIK